MCVVLYSSLFGYAHGQDQDFSKSQATLFLSPRIQTLFVGSTFDVQVFLDTHGTSINTIELDIAFDHDTLAIIQRVGSKSFITEWLEAPKYSNIDGTARFAGKIKEGITTDSGLVITLTFKARTVGNAIIEVRPSSKVIANDGTQINILSELGRGKYSIQLKPPEGVRVFSQTHPFQGTWYNNNNPILIWDKETGVTEFSFVLDNKPLTIPDNNPDNQDTIIFYEILDDGLWFFHIKAKKEERWGPTTHFSLHIDTKPPVPFIPTTEVLSATAIQRAIVRFFTTDWLSGISHYEVGVIDKLESPTESPVFVEAKSPYQLPINISKNVRVIVRAIDKAGNVRDTSIDVIAPASYFSFLKENPVFVLIATLIIILLLNVIHFLFGHHIVARLKRTLALLKSDTP